MGIELTGAEKIALRKDTSLFEANSPRHLDDVLADLQTQIDALPIAGTIDNDALTDDAVTAEQVAFSLPIKMAALGTWAIDGDGAETNGGGIVGDVTLAEAEADLAKVYDNGITTFANLAASDGLTGWANAYQLTADAASEEINDAAYFGKTIPFCEIAFDLAGGSAQVATFGGDAFAWEYWDGAAWSALTVLDRTDTTAGDGKRSFQQSGAIHFTPPSDWAKTTIDSENVYWVRCRVTAAQVTQTPITDAKEHQYVSNADGFTVPFNCRITGVRASDGTTGTLHTAADVKFFLMNFTNGQHSGELTFAQDKRSDSWSSLELDCNAGDVLGVVVVQEDGTNEIINGLLELTVTPQAAS